VKTCFVDLETTGLLHHPGAEAWEFGLITRETHDPGGGYEAVRRADREYLWWVRPDLSRADPAALRVNRFYERTAGAADSREAVNLAEPANEGERVFSDPEAVARVLAPLLADSVIVAQNAWFDAWMADGFLRRNGQVLAADFHLRDLSSMATGYFCAAGFPQPGGGDPLNGAFLGPPGLRRTAIRLGIDLAPYNLDMHTALGDVRLDRDVHDIMIAPYLLELRKHGITPSLD
jgi:hypothetical protein